VPLRASLSRSGEALVEGTLLDGPGSVEVGGQTGFEAYALAAQATAPGTGGESSDLDPDLALDDASQQAAEAAAEFTEELAGDPNSPQRWVHAMRQEEPAADCPFYGWKLGTAEHQPGEYL
jgi:hypothetical protein